MDAPEAALSPRWALCPWSSPAAAGCGWAVGRGWFQILPAVQDYVGFHRQEAEVLGRRGMPRGRGPTSGRRRLALRLANPLRALGTTAAAGLWPATAPLGTASIPRSATTAAIPGSSTTPMGPRATAAAAAVPWPAIGPATGWAAATLTPAPATILVAVRTAATFILASATILVAVLAAATFIPATATILGAVRAAATFKPGPTTIPAAVQAAATLAWGHRVAPG